MPAEAETKFTPGPWELKPMSYGYDLWKGGWFVELRSGAPGHPSTPEDEAIARQFEHDARLIAAAPELFSTLARIVAVHDERNLRGQQICLAERAAITQARKALSKARGES